MSIAGFGFRREATLASLEQALEQLCQQYGDVDRLAVTHAMRPLVQTLGRLHNIDVIVVADADLGSMTTLTCSSYSQQAKGTGSVAEAVALLAAGCSAQLLGPRIISADRCATAAMAKTVVKGVNS